MAAGGQTPTYLELQIHLLLKSLSFFIKIYLRPLAEVLRIARLEVRPNVFQAKGMTEPSESGQDVLHVCTSPSLKNGLKKAL